MSAGVGHLEAEGAPWFCRQLNLSSSHEAHGQGDTVVIRVVEVLLPNTGVALPDLHPDPVRRVCCQLNLGGRGLTKASVEAEVRAVSCELDGPSATG